MKIKFTKMQGCGNDFVILDYCEYEKLGLNMSEAAKKICDRHFGIGADGFIIPNTKAENADIGWFFYNSDGTTAQMCGNGMRCFAKYVYDRKLVSSTEFSVKTLAGIIKPCVLENGLVRVNMSKPILEPEKIPFVPNNNLKYKISVKDRIFEGNAVSMGNPHFVVFVPDVDALDLEDLGPQFEHHKLFPEGVNTEFVQVIDENTVKFRVWERGSGETLACGTGACAVAYACMKLKKAGAMNQPLNVQARGGLLKVTYDSNSNHIFLQGPAVEVFTGEIEIPDEELNEYKS